METLNIVLHMISLSTSWLNFFEKANLAKTVAIMIVHISYAFSTIPALETTCCSKNLRKVPRRSYYSIQEKKFLQAWMPNG